ncbi:retropepsin-like aspartic protease family protein [Sagittula salina]|uniref:TIGR02281 family clan AA aspartic protease n=1 Tax=Sagittula salina TaxID=2820268 RepID=A0A940MLP6_9RHOB|nr:TIGR02281 family clan AA aspartic protease [Sagittula salina]MBP0481012.1 TIGR02281 family clan AA aspartic protease [Sagittula salina]
MFSDHFGQVIVLALIALVIGVRAWSAYRPRPGRFVQALTGWALLFAGALAVAGFWQDYRAGLTDRRLMVVDDGRVQIPRGIDGHYSVTLEVNGAPVRFVIDTGATGMVLTRRDAETVGLLPGDLEFWDRAHTANGAVRTAPVTLDTVSLGPFLDRHVKAYVNDGEMAGSLLGMDYLDRFDRLEISRGKLTLER